MGLSLIKNINRLITAVPSRDNTLGVIENAAMLIRGETIEWVGPMSEFRGHAANETNAQGGVILPGFVDCHTHLVHAGSRMNEFSQRLQGATYEEIAKQGGGILSTVRKTRASSFEDLYNQSAQRLREAVSYGMTTLEIKTGYGLNEATEMKMLDVIDALGKDGQGVTVIPTFLGAHSVPPEFKGRTGEYLDLVIEKMLPQAARQRVPFIDIFIETGAFSVEDGRRLFAAAQHYGMKPRPHVDQLHDGTGAGFAAEMGAVSADHLDYISDAGIAALKSSGTVAVLLPGASFFLGGKKYPPARKLIEAGVPVAISTDYNPGTSTSLNPFLIGTIAATQMRMTLDEVLLGFTWIPARVLGLEKKCGSLAPGKWADFVVLDAAHEYEPFYRFGGNPVKSVFKKGKQIT